MRLVFAALFAALYVLPAAAETTPAAAPERITGTIVSFAAPTLTVKTVKGATATITLAPTAKVIANQRSSFNAIKQNDFVALTAAAGKDGKLKAKEVRVFPEPMRGFGEGQYPGDKTDQTRVNGAVTEAATTVKGKGGTLKLSFHAAAANALGICSGHAPAPGKGGCTGEAEILVTPATPVTTWVLGDPSWLQAGKAVSLYAVTARDGKSTTYGVIVEHDGVKPIP
ncbi:hypothetical protein [Rhizomicrobium electricum]|uniref:DUF5666 domain-containing protein n=1 Tax=Rhizomicrobium electricum TaxID=480070 RepID=A0ABN1EDX5_9PROT|nr:hypothetical protein [Rhizomicrobium electricum]NIJ48698.1 hypothetical protein [Rhizomicrobium electricum]